MESVQLIESWRRLGSTYLSAYARGAERYAQLVAGAGAARAGVPAAESLPQRYAEFVRGEGARLLQRVAEASLDYYTAVLEAGLDAAKVYFEQVVQAQASGAAAAPSGTRASLLFHGEAGCPCSNAFLIANNRAEAIEVGFDLPELASADSSSRVQPSIRFEPPSCCLAPGAQQVVTCTLHLTDELRPGVDYRGQIRVLGFPDMSMGVTVRVDAASKPAAAQAAAALAPTGE
jgi:hypothetical protein